MNNNLETLPRERSTGPPSRTDSSSCGFGFGGGGTGDEEERGSAGAEAVSDGGAPLPHRAVD
jgi:hypothetical protein